MALNPEKTPALPFVSVGMPAYNGEKTIRTAIESLMAQDYPNFELIICDDASTDRTAEIWLEVAGNDPRVRFLRNKNNIGMYANWMKLLNLASGNWRWVGWICLPVCDPFPAMLLYHYRSPPDLAVFDHIS